MNAVRMPDGSLARATGAAGNDIFRGDRLPKDMVGDYFYGEVVARIVRRLRPVKTEGLTQLRNVYPLSEFIRSTDPLFRPVDMTTAPDGTMYITDMYRGIIQESQWSGPGTYLRQRIEQYALDKVVRHGRIWRLTYEGMARDTDAAADAQRDAGAARRAPVAIRTAGGATRRSSCSCSSRTSRWCRRCSSMARSLGQSARAHSCALDARGPRRARRRARARADEGRRSADSHSGDPRQRDALQGRRPSLAADYKTLTKDADVDVVMQALMTLNTLKVADAQRGDQGGAGRRTRRRACSSSPTRS